MRGLFSYEGRLVQTLEKIGELIIVNVAFLLCCIPVVTIGASLTSFYYAMIKSVRRERGNPWKEFFASMKRIFWKGCLFTLEIAAVIAILWFGLSYAVERDAVQLQLLYLVLMVFVILVSVYVFPVLSRFELKHAAMWKLAFIMCFRYFPITIAVTLGSVIVGLLIWNLPVPCVLFIPGFWCYALTFLMEKVLLAYMPKPKEGEDAWYYEGTNSPWRGRRKKGEKHESE